LPCGAGPVAWLSSKGDALAGRPKPLVCVGRDDGRVEVLAWDAKKKALLKVVSAGVRAPLGWSPATTGEAGVAPLCEKRSRILLRVPARACSRRC
jgi:hypothetical protein